MPGFADVSVIVAAYQAAETIERTLKSIAAQTLKPREVVVVDDGSSDGTSDAAEACSEGMNGIELRVFRTEDNLGAGSARNRAIEESTQTYLAFLDSDDEWFPEKLERSMMRIEGTDFALVAHDYVTGSADDAPRTYCEARFHEGPDPFVSLYRKGYIPSCSVVARRDAVIAAGGFDPTLRNAQDFDLWLAMLRKPGTPFLVFDEPLLRYHESPDGIMSHTERRLDCALKIARRYLPDLWSRPGIPLASLWFRIAALYLEAARAYAGRGDALRFLLTVGRLPASMLVTTLSCYLTEPAGREHFLTPKEETSQPMAKAWLPAMFWLWVFAILAAYLYQFRDLVRPILELLGLS